MSIATDPTSTLQHSLLAVTILVHYLPGILGAYSMAPHVVAFWIPVLVVKLPESITSNTMLLKLCLHHPRFLRSSPRSLFVSRNDASSAWTVAGHFVSDHTSPVRTQ